MEVTEFSAHSRGCLSMVITRGAVGHAGGDVGTLGRGRDDVRDASY